MTEPKGQSGTRETRVRPIYSGGMTLRVYVVDREGEIKRDTGVRQISPGNSTASLEESGTKLPPCSCPHCTRERGSR